MLPAYHPHQATSPGGVVPVVAETDRREAVSAVAGNGRNDENTMATGMHSRSLLPWQRVPRSAVLMALNQLAVMAQNGIETAEALRVVGTHCSNVRLTKSLRQIHQAVNNGQPFSGAVAAHGAYFPTTLAPMLAAAEATGEVPQTLHNICRRMRRELEMRSTIVGAMIYPIILIFASVVVMSALILGVLPQFGNVFDSLGRPVPTSTQILLDLGEFARNSWYWVIPVTLGFLGLLIAFRAHPWIQRPLNRFLMYGWLIRNAYRPLLAGRIFRTIAAMVGGGVPLLQAVRLTRYTTNDFYWQSLLDQIESNLIDGAKASSAMVNADFLPPESSQMVMTAERTGRVPEVLDSIGEFYEEEGGRRIKKLVVALEPVIILAMGFIVAGVVMSLMLPLLDVSTVG